MKTVTQAAKKSTRTSKATATGARRPASAKRECNCQLKAYRYACRIGLGHRPPHAPHATLSEYTMACPPSLLDSIAAFASSRADWHITAAQAATAVRVLAAVGIDSDQVKHPGAAEHATLTPEYVGQVPPGYRVMLYTADAGRLITFERHPNGALFIHTPYLTSYTQEAKAP